MTTCRKSDSPSSPTCLSTRAGLHRLCIQDGQRPHDFYSGHLPKKRKQPRAKQHLSRPKTKEYKNTDDSLTASIIQVRMRLKDVCLCREPGRHCGQNLPAQKPLNGRQKPSALRGCICSSSNLPPLQAVIACSFRVTTVGVEHPSSWPTRCRCSSNCGSSSKSVILSSVFQVH